MPFTFHKTDLEGVILIEPQVFGDERGFFLETYKKSDFEKNGIAVDFNQDNHSSSQKGVLRGLHYQANPKAQGKLVRCVRGALFDVAVDIRKDSPNFGKWVGCELTEDNKKMLWIPEGFAHGFLTLSETAEIVYKATNEYSFENDRSIRWDDPDIGVDWGVDGAEVALSEKDKTAPFFKDAEVF